MGEGQRSFSKRDANVLALLFLSGLFPVVLHLLGGVYLPSTDWVSKANNISAALGVVYAGLSIFLISKAEYTGSTAPLKKLGGILVLPILGYISGKNVVILTGPMAVALVAGYPVELRYTVLESNRSSFRWCHSPVDLVGLPKPFNSVCRIPDKFRKQLTAGTRVIVTGHGTSAGAYVTDLDREN